MIPQYAPRAEYVGDGATDEYTFDFKVADLEHLLIIQSTSLGVETFRVRGSDTTYLTSVDFDTIDGGGTVTLVTDVPLNSKLAILLANDEPLQEAEFKNKADFSLSRIEAALDVLAGAIQRLTFLANRSLKADQLLTDATVSAVNWEIPTPVGQAGKTLAVNATEDGFEWV